MEVELEKESIEQTKKISYWKNLVFTVKGSYYGSMMFKTQKDAATTSTEALTWLRESQHHRLKVGSKSFSRE